jgi:hypothetical protein
MLAWLGTVVLRYLTRPKGRRTFHLPPGDAPPMVRALPRTMIAALVLAVAAGPLLRNLRELFPD